MKNTKMKISSKTRNRIFLGIILLSLVFLCVFTLNNYKRTYQINRKGVIELSKNSSYTNAQYIELFFLRHQDVLLTTSEIIAYSLNNEKSGTEEVHDFLRDVSLAYNEKIYKKYASTDFTGIYACVDGTLVHGLKTPEDLPKGYDPTQRPWYIEAILADGSVKFGEPYVDIYSKNMVMTATKMLDDGKTVLGMDITLADLQYAGGNMEVSVNLNGKEYSYGYSLITTDRGIVVAHHDPTKQGDCYEDVTNPRYRFFQKVKEATATGQNYFEINLNGIELGVFPNRLSNGWYVITVTNLTDITNAMSETSLITIAGAILILLISFLYCIIITRSHIKTEILSKNLSKALVLAQKDGLTGYGNRTAFDIYVNELTKKINTANDESFTILMMDLNDLKYVNDNYGHAVGDQYIKNCCRLIHNIASTNIYRIGGDEFVMFLIGDLFDKTEKICKDLKDAVSEGNMLLVPNIDKPSVAIGMCSHVAGTDDIMDDILRKADSEMYVNKANIKKERLKQNKIV